MRPKTVQAAVRSSATAKREAIHRAMLSGLLANVGVKGQEAKGAARGEYTGPRGAKFHIHPGSGVHKKKPEWVMAGELVETTRLYARTVAAIDPKWIEKLGAHLIKKSYSDPYYHRDTARVLASEKVTLYGLTVVPRRTVNYGPIDPATSRELFIHHALVEGEYRYFHPFLKHNLELQQDIRKLEAKTRRRDLLADQRARFGYYAHRLPFDVFDGSRFEIWYREERAKNPGALWMTEEDLLAAAVDAKPGDFPDELGIGGRKFKLEYRYDTGSPLDGITVVVPVELLANLPANFLDYLVPGYVEEKIVALLRSLPKNLRTQFVPAPDFAKRVAAELKPADVPMTQQVAHLLGKTTGVAVPREAFDVAELPPYLVMTLRVVDSGGKALKSGKNIVQLRTELGLRARETFADLPAGVWNRSGLTTWDFPDLPDRVEIELNGMKLPAYPGLVDKGDTIGVRLFEADQPARVSTRAGLRKLFMLQLRKEIEYLERHLPGVEQACLWYRPIGTFDELRKDVVSAAADRAFYDPTDSIRTKADYVDRGRDAWKRLSAAANETAGYVSEALKGYHEAAMKLDRTLPALLRPSADDVREQLSNLVYKGFASRTPHKWLVHLPRYARAADLRLKKLFNAGAARDQINLAVVRPLWEQYLRRREALRKQGIFDPALEEYRWMIEELRVSLFAQELKTSVPVSVKRLEELWGRVRVA